MCSPKNLAEEGVEGVDTGAETLSLQIEYQTNNRRSGKGKIIAQVILFPPLTLLSRLDPDSFGQTVNESGNRQLEGQADSYLATKMIASCLSLTSGQRVQEIIQRG